MAQLFDMTGDDLDQGYMNLRAREHRQEREIVDALEAQWAQYEPYADADFISGFAKDPESRYWEMFLGCSLLDAGKTLRPYKDRPKKGGQPDLCVVENDRRIWIEAIAPSVGEGEDGIPTIVPVNEGGGFVAKPVRQIQLRITSALWNKTNKIRKYVADGVIGKGDITIIAVGASHFGLQAAGPGFPLALSSVFPIGEEFVKVNTDSLEIVERGHHRSEVIPRQKQPIPRTAFIDKDFSDITGLIWSRISIGNMVRAQRPLSFIHNPLAVNPLPQKWGVWDREFIAAEANGEWTVSDILKQNVGSSASPKE